MTERSQPKLPVALTVAGSDSGGGAGIQADLLTFAAHGVYGATAITCITAQNPNRVANVLPVPAPLVREQLNSVADYFNVRVLKTGMLYDCEIITSVCSFLDESPQIVSIVDPVMIATSGASLLRQDAVAALCSNLFPKAALITPNLDEAAHLLGHPISSETAMHEAVRELADSYGVPVLLKGGHLRGDTLIDLLAIPGQNVVTFPRKRIPDVNTHGSGCTLAAAIAANVAKGIVLAEAIQAALDYLDASLRSPVRVAGSTDAFIGHFPQFGVQRYSTINEI